MMKRIVIYIKVLAAAFLFTSLCFNLMAANTMKLSTHTVGSNETFTVRVDINNSNVFAAFQLDVPVPTGFSYIQNSAVLEASRINGQSLQAEIIPGNKLRIIGYSQNNALFVGDSGTIVRFQLKSGYTPGTYPLTLSNPVIGDTNGVNILTNSVNGSVLVQAPDINITSSSIDFSRTQLGQSTTRSLTIFNTGNLPLNITSITFNSSYFEIVGSSTFIINGGANYSLTIKFNSIARGQYNKAMTITSNDPDKGIWNINLSAIAYAVNELHTGVMFAYSGKQTSLTYSINNMDPFTGFQFDLQLPTPLTYVAGSATLTGRKTNHVVSANTLPGNILRVVAYSVNKQVFGGSTGNVVTLTFNVNGTGGNYPLTLSNVVIGDTNSLNCLSDFYSGSLNVASPYISSASSLAFGDVSVLTFKQLPLRVYNNGSDTLKISSILLTNPAFSVLTTFPLNILPGQFTDLQLKFQQSIKGTTTGIMKMYSNDPTRPIYQVNLSGNAFAPNYLVIPALSSKNIDSLWVPVNVNNIEPFVGFQFDLDFPSFMQYIPGSGQLSSRAHNSTLTVQSISSTRIRVLAYSISQSPYTGDTGSIVRLRFLVNSNNESQSSGNFIFSGAILGNALMQNILYQSTNGSVAVRYPHTLSGTVVYNNSANTPMDSVWVSRQQNGVKLDSVRTNTSGTFSFPNVYNGKYRITAHTHKPWGGVNGTDALKIQLHVVGIIPITVPVRLSGADVNNSGFINATDALKVKLRFVGIDSTFDKGNWVFEKTTGGDSVSMGSTNLAVNFYGLCVGDVNGSYIPASGAKTTNEIEISTEEILTANANQEIFLPIMLDRECEMGAFSLTAEFPEELAKIEDFNFVFGKPDFSVTGNKLNVVWSEINPIKINQHEPFAFIKLKTTSKFSPNEIIRFVNASSLTEVSDRSANPIKDLKILIPSLIYSGNEIQSGVFLFPNPAQNRSFLIFNSLETASSVIKIFDMSGRCVSTIGPLTATEGLNKIDIDVTGLKREMYKLLFILTSEHQNIKETKSLIVGF